ncbi:MAG: efflux RND transporter periplasmic adaptor subunit [Thermoanaerobaculia bacterium]
MKRKLVPVLLALAGLAALFFATSCGSDSKASTSSDPPPGEAWIPQAQIAEAGITVEAAAVRDVGSELVLPGRLTFDDQRVSHVFSPVTGRVLKVRASLGQPVKHGDALAVLESPDLGAALSEMAKAKADLEAAERDVRRMKTLFDANAAAARDYEAAEDRFRQARAELDRAQKKARLLKADTDGQVMQEYVLRSPVDGEVIARMVNPGMEVQGQYSAGSAVELYTIGASDRLWALADVYETDLPRVKNGATAIVRVVSWPDRTFEGRVDWISGAVDPVSRTTRVRCILANPDGALKPEMYATVTLTVGGRQALAVPRSALFRMGDSTVVFVRAGKTAEGRVRFSLRPVQTNDEGGSGPVAILKGLIAGEEVVTSGTVLIAGKLAR